MEDISDILKHHHPAKPTEIDQIKDYLEKELKLIANVSIQGESIIIIVGSAAQAGTIRMRLPLLQKAISTKRKLIIRID